MAPSPGICSRKESLLHDCNVTGSDYSRAVQVLTERMGTMALADYKRIRDYSEKARRKAELARRMLDWHVGQHGC